MPLDVEVLAKIVYLSSVPSFVHSLSENVLGSSARRLAATAPYRRFCPSRCRLIWLVPDSEASLVVARHGKAAYPAAECCRCTWHPPFPPEPVHSRPPNLTTRVPTQVAVSAALSPPSRLTSSADVSPSKLEDEFDILAEIGRGAHSVVHSVRSRQEPSQVPSRKACSSFHPILLGYPSRHATRVNPSCHRRSRPRSSGRRS